MEMGMNIQQACEIIEGVAADYGQPILETLMYMQDNLADFDEHERVAFRMFMRDARKLFAPASN
jgi:hypothetical protein